MRLVQVLEPGPRTTVEDLGRRLVGRHGIPAGGAFDPLALIAANRLVGNADGDAGLEITLAGPTLLNAGDEPLPMALVGADFSPQLVRGATTVALRTGAAFVCAPGDTLRIGAARDGARAWLAIAGGIAVPRVAGSRSTALGARFGGLEGRTLARGDLLTLGVPPPTPILAQWREPTPPAACMPRVLRILPGPQLARFGDGALQALAGTAWRVAPDSDRTGVRLTPVEGEPPDALRGVDGIPPEGTTLGAIQVTPDGRPIVLGPDRPVTGGYAKPALVAQADVGRLAMLRPGDVVRLTPVQLDEALALAAARRVALPPRST